MKTRLLITLTIITAVIMTPSCTKLNLQKDVPNCVKNKIRKIRNKEVYNPPAKVYEWKVDGLTYYYFTSDCCDSYNYLYDESCDVVCAPDGGFSGGGDGNCPNFNGPIEWTLVWEDDRE